jgi:hypothetical protein
MNGLAITALVLIGVWLGILTVVIILTVRQIGLLTVRFSVAGGTFSVADDGPEIGSKIPEEVLTTLPNLKQEPTYVLLLSATCTPCREMVTELSGHRFERSVVALVAGREELADGLMALLPDGMRIVGDPDATSFAKALQVKSTPFALAIKDGTVIRKAYMYQAADFVSLVNSESASGSGEITHSTKEVGYVG